MIRIGMALAIVGFGAGAMAQDTDTARFMLGGDTFAAGQNAVIAGAVDNDAFSAGFNVRVTAPVGGDAHLAGFNAGVDAAVAGNVYAGAYSVTIGAPVGADLTAAGNSVTLLPAATVGGNVRLAGRSVKIDGPVGGSALIAAETASLGSTVAGDMQFTGLTLDFASGARIGGTLTIRAPHEIAVPAGVAPASRVVFVQLDDVGRVTGPAQVALEAFQGMSPWVVIVPAIIWNAVLLVIGLIFFAVLPKRSAEIYAASTGRPWWTLLVGFVGLSALFGALGVLGMTVIGIALIPVDLVVIAVAWVLAQVVGAYVLGGRIVAGLNVDAPPLAVQMAGLLAGLVVVWVLGFVPFLGWLAWLTVLILGIGGFARSLIERGGREAKQVA